jgi:hypothetical protein
MGTTGSILHCSPQKRSISPCTITGRFWTTTNDQAAI